MPTNQKKRAPIWGAHLGPIRGQGLQLQSRARGQAGKITANETKIKGLDIFSEGNCPNCFLLWASLGVCGSVS